MERPGAITFKGAPMTLVGQREVKVGDPAPDFTVTTGELKDLTLADLKGQPVVISVVPSLDTGVCQIQTQKFNEQAREHGLRVVTVSCDLPFAQKRFCESFKANNITCVSDYKSRSFGEAFGVVIKELALLARSVFVLDAEGKVVYREIVSEVTHEPDYGKALEAVRGL
ncbi:MAG TPA: thiol peroxidase [Candidatus Hydrogenedentes bacterium]|nr:MAG: putative thiol peroxidase [candidate division BRC1 bacterium ADurb.BinA292]HOF41620.1 thiol peroxidase [Candidatus Hydrogenedentota bacterium]HOR29425.1 thiol peroxidase [Candidatus Sumerlaeota bacterium]HPK02844.1 thiol peroxidase [Candidatus Sumerlaeota bacterium]